MFFEDLITNLSSTLANVPSDEVNVEIARALDSIRHSFRIDCTALMEVRDRQQIQIISMSRREEAEQLASAMPEINSFPWVYRRVVEMGQPIIFSSLAGLPPEAERERSFWENSGIEAMLLIPLRVKGAVTHLISLASSTNGFEWPQNCPRRLGLIGELIVRALLDRAEREAGLKIQRDLRKALEEVSNLRKQFNGEEANSRWDPKFQNRFPDIIGASDPLRYVLYRIEQVARTKTTVLLMGETGTGKGLFARSLHEASNRRDKLFVNVNCAGLAPNLIESELFGREKGAFTGSTAKQIGRFELADRGTIFLDEIAELSLDLQSKLLKVIESGEFERLGSPRTIKVDVRIIACTNRNLEEEIQKGRFRRDLFYRLNVFPITIPPLRERKKDISLIVNFYLEKFSRMHGKDTPNLSENAMKTLENYCWAGNVRELINVIERAVIMSRGPELRLEERMEVMPFDPLQQETLNGQEEGKRKGLLEIEREHILAMLQEIGWKIEGSNGAAILLGINPSTLRSRMKKLGIRKPHKASGQQIPVIRNP